MDAVIYNGYAGAEGDHQARCSITVERRPIPEVEHERDVVVKVTATALCGSDLHLYRGLERPEAGFILGHELVGLVHAVGEKASATFAVGDRVVSPFTTSCASCWYCKRGLTSRCDESRLFGSPKLDGCQAGYVRVPLGDTTLFHAPEDLSDEILVVLADILPTGHHASSNARDMLPESELADAVVVVVGCGPVGICAITSASMWVRPGNLYAVDSVQERLDQAERHGAIALHLDGQGDASPLAVIRLRTDGRGADAVLEVVGLKPAYKTALSLIRPFGVISSVGVHNDPSLLSGPDTYDLNLRCAFGRCPVRAEFPEALEVLRAKRALFEGVDGAGSGFVSHWMDLEDAPEAYRLFDERKVRKVVFRPRHD